MAATWQTAYEATIVGYPVKTALFKVTTTEDFFTFDADGIIPLNAMVISSASSGYQCTPYYAAATVSASVAATTTTSIAYMGASDPKLIPDEGYMITTAGEVFMVTNNTGADTGSTGTLTVVRGCLGTTASTTGLTKGSIIASMRSIKFANPLAHVGALVPGYIVMTYIELPSDPKANFFPQA